MILTFLGSPSLVGNLLVPLDPSRSWLGIEFLGEQETWDGLAVVIDI